MPTLIKVLKLENEEVSPVDHAHQILQEPKRGQNLTFMSLRKGKDAYKLPPSQFTVITTRPLGKQITSKSHIKHVAPGLGYLLISVHRTTACKRIKTRSVL